MNLNICKKQLSCIVIVFVLSNGLMSCKNATTTADDKTIPLIKSEATSSSNSELKNEMTTLMLSSINGIDTLISSGNYDLDFARLMIVHHQAAIALGTLEIETGSNQEIKILAQNMIILQENEIAQMEQFIKTAKAKSNTKMQKMPESLLQNLDEMIAKMNYVKLSESIDENYITLMIIHHEGAIKMATSEIKNGSSDVMINSATQTIEIQLNEIAGLKSWVNNVR